MSGWNEIWHSHRIMISLFAALVFCCFAGVYILAGPYSLIRFCDSGVHLFSQESCGWGIQPLIVRMNAETLDPGVASLLPPLSYTEDVGWHLLGTDALGRDVFSGILYGGQRSLLIGFLSGGLAMILGWFVGIWSVYVRWSKSRVPVIWLGLAIFSLIVLLTKQYLWLLFIPGAILVWIWARRYGWPVRNPGAAAWIWGRGIEWYQALPDLLLLLVLSSAIGILHTGGLVVIIVAVIWPSQAMLARRLASEVSRQPYFSQALRNRVPGRYLILHYLWRNSRSVFFALFPLVVARVILLESTLSFLGMGLPPDMVTIGSMISAARFNIQAWWLIVFSCLFIFILVYPLMFLGRYNGRQRIL